MAHQDYVARAKAPKKKHSSHKKQPEARPGLPMKVKIITLIVLLAVIGFGYLLWYIKDIKPAPPVVSNKTPTTTQQEGKLPEPPQEKWQYMEELKSKEVEVGEYTVEAKGPYKMQCGSFKTSKQAQVMKANIAFSGLSAQISEVSGSNGTWYKVFLGPYNKKRSAEKDKHKLKSNGITTCQIWLWK